MSVSSLERVRQDLEVIKAGLSNDFPYDRRSVVMSAGAAACGILFALRAVPGWDRVMTGILLSAVFGLLLLGATWLRRAHAERGRRPRRWSWGREEFTSGGVAVLAAIVYVLTRRLTIAEGEWAFESWRGQLAGPTLFAFSVAMLALGVARPERRSFLGWGAALTAVGLAMPWIPSRTGFWVTCGVAMALGGLISTAILWRQMREWESTRVGD